MADPEIRELAVATARAYAIAERLAHELDNTVDQLVEYAGRAKPGSTEPQKEKK